MVVILNPSPLRVILSPSPVVMLSPAAGGIDSAKDLVVWLRINSVNDIATH